MNIFLNRDLVNYVLKFNTIIEIIQFSLTNSVYQKITNDTFWNNELTKRNYYINNDQIPSQLKIKTNKQLFKHFHTSGNNITSNGGVYSVKYKYKNGNNINIEKYLTTPINKLCFSKDDLFWFDGSKLYKKNCYSQKHCTVIDEIDNLMDIYNGNISYKYYDETYINVDSHSQKQKIIINSICPWQDCERDCETNIFVLETNKIFKHCKLSNYTCIINIETDTVLKKFKFPINQLIPLDNTFIMNMCDYKNHNFVGMYDDRTKDLIYLFKNYELKPEFIQKRQYYNGDYILFNDFDNFCAYSIKTNNIVTISNHNIDKDNVSQFGNIIILNYVYDPISQANELFSDYEIFNFNTLNGCRFERYFYNEYLKRDIFTDNIIAFDGINIAIYSPYQLNDQVTTNDKNLFVYNLDS
jgi:hypothetical protein